MKRSGKKALSVFLALVLLFALLPEFTATARADEEFYTTCEVCGETMTLDEWGDYHAAGDCWFCGDCYGLVTQCPNCGLHLCDETHCEENGHCLDDVNGAECPFDIPCDDFDDGHCPLCCQEAYDNTGHECGICPYSSEWEDHFCQDDGCCYKECADAAGIQADSPDDIYCPDCGHCYRYSWDYADHECDVHDCPCQCTLCPNCGNCVESSYCTPCEDCGAECNCECVYCDFCGMCLNSEDHEVCPDCGRCSEEWVECPYCNKPCNCTCEACPYCGIDCVNDPEHDVCPICGKCKMDPTYKACDVCGQPCDHSGTPFASQHQKCPYCGIHLGSSEHDAMKCPYCDIDCVKDPAHEVCPFCGKCLKDPAVTPCKVCGAKCGCQCVKEGYCPDCGACRNTRTKCWTCGAACSCVCDKDRCPGCGLCKNGRMAQYGIDKCPTCGLCPCLCKCSDDCHDKAAAYTQPDIMAVTVRVYDRAETLPGVPVYACNDKGKARLLGYTHDNGSGEAVYNVVIPSADAAAFTSVRACAADGAKLSLADYIYSAGDGAKAALTYKKGTSSVNLTLDRTSYRTGAPVNVSFTLFDDPKEVAYLNNYSVDYDTTAKKFVYTADESGIRESYGDALYSALATDLDLMKNAKLSLTSSDGRFSKSYSMTDVLYSVYGDEKFNVYGTIATVPSGTYKLSAWLPGHSAIVNKLVTIAPDYAVSSNMALDSEGKPDGYPDSVYYLGNGSKLKPAYPFDKYAPGWGDDVTAVECYMSASEQPDVTVNVELGGLSGSELDKALAGMSVSVQKNVRKDNSCSIVFDGTGSEQTFWNLPVGTHVVTASDPAGEYVFSPASVTTVRKGEDVNVTVRGVKPGEMGGADFFVTVGGSYGYNGGTLYYTVQDADGNRVCCGGSGAQKSDYGYADVSAGSTFSAKLPAGEYRLSAAFMPAPAEGEKPKAEDMQKYTHVTEDAFTVSAGVTSRVFENIEAVAAVSSNIYFQRRSPNTGSSERADVKPGSSVLTAEIYTQPLPEVMSRGGSLQPCLTASAKVSTDASAAADPYDLIPVDLAPGVYSVKVTATKSYKDEDYKGTSYGYGQLKVAAGGAVPSTAVFQQDSLDTWRVRIKVTDGAKPIPFADVKLRESNLGGENWTHTYRADADGVAELRLNLPANRLSDGAAGNSYEIFARADGYNGGDWVQYAGAGVNAKKEMTITTLTALAGLASKDKYDTSAGYDAAQWNTTYGTFNGIEALYYGTYFSTVGGSNADTYRAAIAKMDLWHQYGSRASFDLFSVNKKNNKTALEAAEKAYCAVDKMRTGTAYPITLDLGTARTLDYVTFELRDVETGAVMTDRDTAVKEGEETSNHVLRTWYKNPGASEVQINEIEDQSQSPWLQTGTAHVLKSAVAQGTTYSVEYTSTIGANGRNGDYITFAQPYVSFTKDGGTETHKLQYNASDVAGSESKPHYIENMKLTDLSYLDDGGTAHQLIADGISSITVQLWMEHKYTAVAGNGSCIRLIDADTGALIRAADSSIDVWTAASGGEGGSLHVDESVLLDKFTYGPEDSHYTAVPFPYTTLDDSVTVEHGDFPLGYYNELGLGTSAVGVVAHAKGYENSAYTLVPLHDLANKSTYYALYYVDIPMTPTSASSSWYTVEFRLSNGTAAPYAPVTVKSGGKIANPAPSRSFYKDKNLTKPYDFAKDVITGNTMLYTAANGTVTGVKVTAGSTSGVKQGESISVKAAVTGVGTFNANVAWTVSPAGAASIADPNASETTVTPNKAADGKMYPFVLTAVSKADKCKSDSVCLYAYPADKAVNGYGSFHTLKVENASGGGKRREGSVVTTVSAPAVSGQRFSKWECDSADVTLSSMSTAKPTFTMPAHDVKLTAVYVESSGGSAATTTYTLTFETNGGGALTPITKDSGATVDLAAYKPARNGYTFAGWYSDAALTNAVSSVTLTADATVYAGWTADAGTNPFADVPDDAYYHDAVVWAAGKGITDGTAPGTFEPLLDCSRAQVMTFIWRAMGSPEPDAAANPFKDTAPGAYYYKAVLWAVGKGVTKGTGDTTFSPDDTVTRAEFVTFLWRLAGSPAPKGASPFGDVTDAGAWYYGAVLWAAEKGITKGTAPNAFSPDGFCTRAEVVTFLWRYFGK